MALELLDEEQAAEADSDEGDSKDETEAARYMLAPGVMMVRLSSGEAE